MKKERDRHESKLGRYPLGTQVVDVFTHTDNMSGSIRIWPKTGGTSRIDIGIAENCWREVLEVLSHEALEFLAIQLQLRWTPAPSYADSHSDYLFAMNHTQFQEMVARFSPFLCTVVPDLQKVFDARHKKPKK